MLSRSLFAFTLAALLAVLPFNLPMDAIPPTAVIVPQIGETTPSQPLAQEEKSEQKPAHAIVAAPEVHAEAAPAFPSELSIHAIKLHAPIVAVGVNEKGEMDVPSGTTKNVGWYRNGTVPGDVGSAVLDAHVFAAFSNLDNLKISDDIYVANDHGSKLHFKVTATQMYRLADVPLQQLFNDTSGRNLNLITCAGKYIPSQDTYSHRLIVYTTLVS